MYNIHIYLYTQHNICVSVSVYMNVCMYEYFSTEENSFIIIKQGMRKSRVVNLSDNILYETFSFHVYVLFYSYFYIFYFIIIFIFILIFILYKFIFVFYFNNLFSLEFIAGIQKLKLCS